MTDEMIINGIRYVPAGTAAPMISEVLRVLADLFWGEGHTPEDGFQDLRIRVSDDFDDGTTFDEFAARLAEVIARRVASQEGPQEPLSARERRVALLAGGQAPEDPLFKSELELATEKLERDMASWAVEQR